jgi:hypothetical protein
MGQADWRNENGSSRKGSPGLSGASALGQIAASLPDELQETGIHGAGLPVDHGTAGEVLGYDRNGLPG